MTGMAGSIFPGGGFGMGTVVFTAGSWVIWARPQVRREVKKSRVRRHRNIAPGSWWLLGLGKDSM